MNKNLLLTWLFLACSHASAQEPIQQFSTALRPICMKVVEKDMVRDMAKFSSVPLNAETVCDCANERLIRDPVAKRLANLTKDERRVLPKAEQLHMYLSAEFLSASLACYAEAIRVSAEHIDVIP